MGGSIYTSHTLNLLKELGLDTRKAHKTALKSHAPSSIPDLVSSIYPVDNHKSDFLLIYQFGN